MRLKLDPPLVAQSVSLPVFATLGHWKPDRFAEMVAKVASNKSGGLAKSRRTEKLPSRLPQEVLLIVGQADLFPYRIEYRQTANTAQTPDAGTPYQLSSSPLLQLEFSDVSFTTQIAASQFDYSPGDVQWTDRTTEQIQKLRRERQGGAADGNNTATVGTPKKQR